MLSSFDRRSDSRPVLYVNLAGPQEPIAERLAARGWDLHAARSICEAQRLIEERPFLVCLVAVSSGSPLAELERLVLASPAMEWVALLPSRASGPERFLKLVAEVFFDYHSVPCDAALLAQVLGHAHGKAVLRRRVPHGEQDAPDAIVGESEPMRRLFRSIAKVGANDAPVLVHGESGTGKELAAQAVHRASRRADKPFVVIDCGALAPSLIQSELFGYERGAFTGATQAKQGLIEAAAAGTVFLDEIGDLPRELQTNLLRFLQERTIGRVGSTRKIALDVRVIAATHVDLERAVDAGRFREDLYYRLKVVHFAVPPLRERIGDAELLARHFFKRFAAERSPGVKGFSHDALRAINVHRWPGNVRELMNRVRSAMVMGESSLLGASDLGLDARGARAPAALGTARAIAEREAVEASLRNSANNVSRAARALGVSRMTLYRLMEKYGILRNRTLVPETLQASYAVDRS